MATDSAASASRARSRLCEEVATRGELLDTGMTVDAIRAHLDAQRWRRLGSAIVLHNAGLSRIGALQVALANCGPRAILSGFTALEEAGLHGWTRPWIDVLVPVGVRPPKVPDIEIRLHRTRNWSTLATLGSPRRQAPAGAATLAASRTRSPRVAVGLLAAVVQQRLVRTGDLIAEIDAAKNIRHRREMRLGLLDIEMGSQALSEIDLVALCRRFGLPIPHRQAVRIERDGRRRYLDALWTLADGRTVAVEIDGAVHTAAARWFDDQLRQNVIVLSGTVVLRYPSVIVRSETALVAEQLGQALGVEPRCDAFRGR